MKRMNIFFIGGVTEVLILPKWYKIKGCGGWLPYDDYEKLLEFLYEASGHSIHNDIYAMAFGESVNVAFKDLFDIRRKRRIKATEGKENE
jgi:hypothetical protein